MTISTFLLKFKANRYTYYQYDKKSIEEFKNTYNFLKQYKDKNISIMAMKKANKIFENNKYDNFLKKYKAMETLLNAI